MVVRNEIKIIAIFLEKKSQWVFIFNQRRAFGRKKTSLRSLIEKRDFSAS